MRTLTWLDGFIGRCDLRAEIVVAATVVAATAGGFAAQAPSPANAAAGAAIVAGKGECLTCHRVQARGSRLGPDLTDIGANRTTEHLQTSLLDPDAEILPENRFYRVVTREGATITGRLLNLDTFQVLMIDPKEQLRSFQKSDLREHGFAKGSTMPSYRAKLSSEEIADVIAYMSTLKGVTPQ
jgi:putative heme-binding domain-containing protein